MRMHIDSRVAQPGMHSSGAIEILHEVHCWSCRVSVLCQSTWMEVGPDDKTPSWPDILLGP